MDKPVVTRLQRAWLQEIGVDARMLAHLSAAPFAGLRAPDDPPPVVAAEGPAAASDPSRRDGPASIRQLLKQAMPERPPAPAAEIPAQGREPLAAAPSGAPGGGDLDSLREHVAGCEACGLHEVRGRTVFGEGAGQAPHWMFIGEAPGEYDDSMGRPFQGRAGDLLRAMLASVGITDASPAYFTNVLKCRPMGNRSPEAGEIAACLPFLRRQISLLRPACLVALGRVSAGTLLGRNEELDALRGRVHAFVDDEGRSIPLIVTHHPVSLLLHAQYKADAWRDLNLLRDCRPDSVL